MKLQFWLDNSKKSKWVLKEVHLSFAVKTNKQNNLSIPVLLEYHGREAEIGEENENRASGIEDESVCVSHSDPSGGEEEE